MHQYLRGAPPAKKIHDDVEHLRVQDRRRLEILTRRGRSCQNEDAGTNHGTNSQRRQRPGPETLLQTMSWSFRFRDQLVDRLAAKNLLVGGAHNFFRWRLARRGL